MTLSDYLVQRLENHGVRHIFLVTGGGAMHLNDAIGRSSKIQYVCNHHEQACAMAAEGYSRAGGGLGVINVTTGPGGINAMTGVFGAWIDSVPMMVISGQVKREMVMASHPGLQLRQLGFQEADVVSMVKGMMKYLVEQEGILLDPIYSAKAFAGLLDLARKGELGGRVVFWHTGGLPTLFATG